MQVLLFVNFSTELDAFQSKYKDVAVSYKGDGLSFLLGDVDAGAGAFKVSNIFSAYLISKYWICQMTI